MNQMYSLLKREWLEHKETFIWVPIIVSVVIVIFVVVFQDVASEMLIETSESRSEVIDGVTYTNEDKRTVSLSEVMSGGDEGAAAADLRGYYSLPLVVIILLALLASTLDERKDGSILFFKSMPVSDTLTILSKYTAIVWLAPLITLGCILLLQLCFATWSGLNPNSWPQFAGASVGGYLQLATATIVGYLLYGLWAFPVFAWVMLVGAWSQRGAILWALGIPFAIQIVEGIAFGTEQFKDALFRHLSPGLGVELNSQTTGGDLIAQVATLDFWGGIAVGASLLGLTIYCRRTQNEI